MKLNAITQSLISRLSAVDGITASDARESIQALPAVIVYPSEGVARIKSPGLVQHFHTVEVTCLVTRSQLALSVSALADVIEKVLEAIEGWVVDNGFEVSEDITYATRPVYWGSVLYYGAIIKLTIKTLGGA
jgi:hypothetical protein